jgi:hypothetical protein
MYVKYNIWPLNGSSTCRKELIEAIFFFLRVDVENMYWRSGRGGTAEALFEVHTKLEDYSKKQS